MSIEFLYFRDCPGHQAAFALLTQVLREEKVEEEILRIEVPGPEAAAEFRFMGSPSIRIDGTDVEGSDVEAELGFGWSCRYYAESEPGQSRSVPAADLIRRRLRERSTR